MGQLQPATHDHDQWVVKSEGKEYVILNAADFKDKSWFGYGATVTLDGNLRSDITMDSTQATAIYVNYMDMTKPATTSEITGILRRTTEAGGWLVESGEKKYVLMDYDTYKTQGWFQEGNEVIITGMVRPDIPTVFMEGDVLKISDMTPHPNAVTGAQAVEIYFQNATNIFSNQTSMVKPVKRQLQGPNLPEKALQAILDGPTPIETVKGFFVDSDLQKLTLDSFQLVGNMAKVTFAAQNNFEFDNDYDQKMFKEQITQTLLQFKGIGDVELTIQTPELAKVIK